MPNYMENSTTMPLLCPLPVHKLLYMRNQQWEEVGQYMELKGGISVLPWSTIGAIAYILIKQEGSVIQNVLIFPHNTPLPYNSSSKNIIIAAQKLDHTLQNPAPNTPFSNIGDSQMLAIYQLSDIFPWLQLI